MISDTSSYIGKELNKFNIIMSQSRHNVYLSSFYIDNIQNTIAIFGSHNGKVVVWTFTSILDITFNNLLYKLLKEYDYEIPYTSENIC